MNLIIFPIFAKIKEGSMLPPYYMKVCFNAMLLMFCALILFCKTPQKPNNSASSVADVATQSPEGGKIEATVIKIMPVTKEDSGTVCAKAPCRALLKVSKIGNCGRTFAKTFQPGDTIMASFVYTLEPTTADLFPDLKYLYPGLKKGSSFAGEIQSRMRPGAPPSFYIYHYELKNEN